MKFTGDVLKTNVPEFMQSFPNLMSYLGVVGDFLDETKSAIKNNFDYAQDYELSTAFGLENSLESLGFEIPPNLRQDLKRVILRDAIEIFIKTGTEDSILWVLKILGIDPEIRYAWLPSPVEVRKGYIVDPLTGDSRRYDVNKFAYTEFLYGSEQVTEDGVFFTGYKYTDPYQENPIEDLPIIGQRYNVMPQKVAVAKTPYVVVRIGGEGFNSITENYEDDRGFTETEIFKVVNDLIEYFLFQTTRPTPVRIILIVSLQELADELTIDETYDDTGQTHAPTPEVDDLNIDSVNTRDGTVTLDEEILIGTKGIWLGDGSPYDSQLSLLSTPVDMLEPVSLTSKTDIKIVLRQDILNSSNPDSLIPETDIRDVLYTEYEPVDKNGLIEPRYSIETVLNKDVNLDNFTGTGIPEIPFTDCSQLNITAYITEDDNSILMRGLTEVEFSAPSDTSVEVRGVYHKSNFSNYQVLATVSPNAPFNYINDNADFHYLLVVFNNPSSETIEATVNHNIPV